ncbi:uncharacterized protein LOC133441083 [Cololabis saira]|uniref:uncharacterized protein LOC133441083 n=1 Tax=Cololabis saira TaxID=129043 RepID=UPI002AD4AB57|nr:uncharacterized protein LOC133441083 [Cololabis saira]
MMYSSQNDTLCSAGDCCQLFKSMDMRYTASCTSSCADSCVNASQTNCSVNCCNSTGCLNDTFASMMMTTTVAAPITTTTSQATPTTTTSTTTTVNNGNKCHKDTCTGENCYTGFKAQNIEMCNSSQPHCQLKKETVGSAIRWTAGCTNCTGQAACKGSTQPPCNLECCNATMTSCLRLNGTLNVPSFATRGPHLHTEVIASFICLLVLSLLV